MTKRHSGGGPTILAVSSPLTREDVVHVARLARLALSEAEIEQFTDQLGAILEHAARVAALDTHDVPPTSHPIPLANVLRTDSPLPCLDRDVVLSMAPAAEDGRFRVPRILGEEA
ncbi:MAG TPA: Asp-tRNA(Asn)/Glu-tRNA(Gln) amidotransferase subunit GatC [Acidimicrobiia bacterium]|nr:Asp-tRNA(Asn)/Glu-tRNA(Gln) amidotransferase subunit GatC [Acidimicrobiia bacterium]